MVIDVMDAHEWTVRLSGLFGNNEESLSRSSPSLCVDFRSCLT